MFKVKVTQKISAINKKMDFNIACKEGSIIWKITNTCHFCYLKQVIYIISKRRGHRKEP